MVHSDYTALNSVCVIKMRVVIHRMGVACANREEPVKIAQRVRNCSSQ